MSSGETKKIDLHVHSDFSEDADHSVEEIFSMSEEAGLSAVSITDHDSLQSIDAAKNYSDKNPFVYIPGVELTTVFSLDKSQQHILGYFISNKDPELLSAIDKISAFRNEIGAKRIRALKNLGFVLNDNSIWERAGTRPPTPVSITLELFENKNNADDPRLFDYLHGEKKEKRIASFYQDYFTKDKPAYVEFQSISTEEGIDIIKRSGGIPILAHPVYLKNEYLDIIKDMGIAGLEAVSTYHNNKEISFYIKYAEKNRLLITAGSDFHGQTAKPHIKLGTQEGMDFKFFEALIGYKNKK